MRHLHDADRRANSRSPPRSAARRGGRCSAGSAPAAHARPPRWLDLHLGGVVPRAVQLDPALQPRQGGPLDPDLGAVRDGKFTHARRLRRAAWSAILMVLVPSPTSSVPRSACSRTDQRDHETPSGPLELAISDARQDARGEKAAARRSQGDARARRRRCDLRYGRGAVHPARPVRLRQDDDAALDRRPGTTRPGDDRRSTAGSLFAPEGVVIRVPANAAASAWCSSRTRSGRT